MTYPELVLEYKRGFKNVSDLISNTDEIFASKYFPGGKSDKKFSLPFIPGEIYSFSYVTDTQLSENRKFINRNPIVLCIDSFVTKENGLVFRGIDLITVPPEYRLQILGKIYDTFIQIIEKNQSHYTEGGNVTAVPLTNQNLKSLLSNTGYASSVFGFKTKFMREISILDLDDWEKMPYLKKSMIEGLDLQGIYSEYQSKLI